MKSNIKKTTTIKVPLKSKAASEKHHPHHHHHRRGRRLHGGSASYCVAVKEPMLMKPDDHTLAWAPEDISAALFRQIELQKQLHEQLLRQRELQTTIEEHGKYLQLIMGENATDKKSS